MRLQITKKQKIFFIKGQSFAKRETLTSLLAAISMPWLLKMWHAINREVTCDMFDKWWISMTCRQLLFRQFRDMARLLVYCLHTKISFKQTNKHPRESSYLNHNDLLYKGKPKFYSDFSCLWDAKLFNLFVVNLTQLSNRQIWSGVLHISFLHCPSGEIIHNNFS